MAIKIELEVPDEWRGRVLLTVTPDDAKLKVEGKTENDVSLPVHVLDLTGDEQSDASDTLGITNLDSYEPPKPVISLDELMKAFD